MPPSAEGPTTAQLVVLIVSIIFLLIGGAISVLRVRAGRAPSERLRIAAKACFWSGVTGAIAVLVWHAVGRRDWIPLEDNFEALISLSVMLGLFVMYVQRRRPIGGLDWFIMPIVVLLLIGAVFFGRARPHRYVRDIWVWLHYVSAFGGAFGFAIAGAAGAMYLVNNRQLRVKTMPPSANFGSLERLEHVTLASATLGFALLTVAAVTGFVQIFFEHRGTSATKVALTACAWLAYALVLHSPINPSF